MSILTHMEHPAGAACLILMFVSATARTLNPAPAVGNAAADSPPEWAFPGTTTRSLSGSRLAYSAGQLLDRTAAVDWFPDQHRPMPAAVKGQTPLYACGYCHLPEGAGRPENAALAGLPYDYLTHQLDDIRAGDRISPDPRFVPGIGMVQTIRHPLLSKGAADEAARYYSELTYTKRTTVIETGEIPHATADDFVYVFDHAGPKEPLGERIIEGPDDFARFEMRDARVNFTAYVPPGSIIRGAALVRGSAGMRAACDSCHGPGLKGGSAAPPIAGRPLTPMFRQLYAFRNGTRHGAGAGQMQAVVAGLSNRDFIDLASYAGSLEP